MCASVHSALSLKRSSMVSECEAGASGRWADGTWTLLGLCAADCVGCRELDAAGGAPGRLQREEMGMHVLSGEHVCVHV